MNMKNELQVSSIMSGITKVTAAEIKKRFDPYIKELDKFSDKANLIVVKNESQIEEMRMAKVLRLELKTLRVNVEKARKAEKQESLRKGQAIDAIANYLKDHIIPIETHLKKQEDFIKIKEEQRQERLAAKREKELEQYSVDVSTLAWLGNMPDPDYQKILDNAKKAYQDAKEAAAKEERERIAREKAEAEERARMQKENERLRAEHAKAEKKLEAERKKRESAELEAELLAADAQAKEEEEKRKIEAEKEKERKLALAPDKDKLELLAGIVANIKIPDVEDPDARDILRQAVDMLNDVAVFLKKAAVDL